MAYTLTELNINPPNIKINIRFFNVFIIFSLIFAPSYHIQYQDITKKKKKKQVIFLINHHLFF